MALWSNSKSRDLTINLGKTKVNTTPQWVGKPAPFFTNQVIIVEYAASYVYIQSSLYLPGFFMRETVDARRTRGCAALEMLEKICSQVQFHVVRTKLWFFDSMVTPTILHKAPTWGPSLDHHSCIGEPNDG